MPFIIFLLALFVGMTFLKDYNFLQHFRKQEQIHFLESYKTDLPADSRFAKTFVGTTTKDQRTLLLVVAELKYSPTEPSPLKQFRTVNVFS